ncbi:MAG: hypothetical protein FH758_13735 [Firmicutes bacterium]|nr:hypothetical protein [Bacillota bacterium]
MNCQETRENLNAYLASEHQLFDKAKLEKHLDNCPQCQGELEQLQALNNMLNSLPNQGAPASLKTDILATLSKPNSKSSPINKGKLVRDLLAAAAVSLAIFWSGLPLFNGTDVDKVNQSFNKLAANYTQATGSIVNKTVNWVDKTNNKIHIKEWKIK